MALNINTVSSPTGAADQNLPCALKGRLNGWKSARLLRITDARRCWWQIKDPAFTWGTKKKKNCLPHREMTGNYHRVGGWRAFTVSTFIEELKHEREKKKRRMNKCSHPDKPNKVLRESSF